MTFTHFMPHWAKQDQCYEEEKIEFRDKAGKKIMKSWHHDKSVPQIVYEEFMKVIVNPDTNEYYHARDRDGSEVKNTTAKYIVNQIIRLKRKSGDEFLYSQGRIEGYDAFGNRVHRACSKPEMWVKPLFDRQRMYNQRTNTTVMQTVGTLGLEDVYEMPFNEANLKQLVSQRENDTDITFTVKDEASNKAVQVMKDVNINKTMELFLKPFDYLFKSEYISPQVRSELRQAAIDQGIIPPSNPVTTDGPPPPKGTYS